MNNLSITTDSNDKKEDAEEPVRTELTINSSDEFYFGKFCCHVPRILRHQLISKLVNQYLFNATEKEVVVDDQNRTLSNHGDPGVDFKSNVSIYRFHGALLFVDISGFTVLSQKLKVDDLKNQINAYFQKIVDIINKYGGEIIKFAGDALFVVWQTHVENLGDETLMLNTR
jgi:hypothetical protein